MLRFGVIFVMATLTTVCPTAASQQTIPSKFKTVKIPAGQTVTVWTGVNVTGRVYLVIRTRDGSNSLRLWWLKHPLGRPEQLGEKSGDFDVAIPSLAKGAVGVQLRAKAHDDTVVYVGENVALGQALTFKW